MFVAILWIMTKKNHNVLLITEMKDCVNKIGSFIAKLREHVNAHRIISNKSVDVS